jgi:hypothetical protein
VQIIESTEAGVRSVELRLQRAGSPLQFLLYPMLHVGQPEFYAEVTRRLHLVDLIVVEGVGGQSKAAQRAQQNDEGQQGNESKPVPKEKTPEEKTPATTTAAADQPLSDRAVQMINSVARFRSALYWLTASYRTMTEDERLGLVEQNIDYAAIGVPVICPDVSVEQFEEQWRTIPAWQRGAIIAATVPVVAAQRLFGSRWLQDRLPDHSMDDLLSREEEFMPDIVEELDRVILHQRDVPLLKVLTGLHEQRSKEPITVAVVYGAAHMRAVLKGLRPLGYRVVSGDWLTVMTF